LEGGAAGRPALRSNRAMRVIATRVGLMARLSGQARWTLPGVGRLRRLKAVASLIAGLSGQMKLAVHRVAQSDGDRRAAGAGGTR